VKLLLTILGDRFSQLALEVRVEDKETLVREETMSRHGDVAAANELAIVQFHGSAIKERNMKREIREGEEESDRQGQAYPKISSLGTARPKRERSSRMLM